MVERRGLLAAIDRSPAYIKLNPARCQCKSKFILLKLVNFRLAVSRYKKTCNNNCLIARLSISSMLAQSIKGVISEFDKNSKWLHNLQVGYQVFVFIENCGIYQISTLNSETGLINLKCIRRPSVEVIDLSRCFIIMSMDSDKPELIDVWESLKEGIKNPGDKFGIDVSARRIDDFKGQTHKIDSKVFEEIEKSGIIIADLSGERPNCYLEVGYALARQKN